MNTKYNKKKAVVDSIEDDDNLCVVCFRDVNIYSIGECDHPVCHECSTRMRVLCDRNECTICRKDMAMVVFATEVDLFSTFSYRNMNCERRYSIYFKNDFVMKAFDELLEHRCNVCSSNPKFKNFSDLKEHVKKQHEQFYCDLCIDNLKIFTKERRSYIRSDLAQHRRKGDRDDKSHKGHPLCEFCDSRFMDIDELYRHLRRDHFFCHFCDADGHHHYYDDYDHLRRHFRSDHFLCEEGNCIEERYTSVYRSKLDLQAHTTQMHGHMMSKAQARQARTVDIEFTVNHRQGQYDRGGRGGRQQAGRRNYDPQEQERAAAAAPPSLIFAQPPPTPSVDIKCEQDFPSLAGEKGVKTLTDGGARNSIANRVAHANKFTIRTRGPNGVNEEEFPSLGSTSVTINSGPAASQAAPSTTTSVHLSLKKNKNNSLQNKGPNVSIKYKCNNNNDFPSLEQPNKIKPKISMVSHSNNITFQKGSAYRNSGAKPKSTMMEDDFPSLQSKNSKSEKVLWTGNSLSSVVKAPKKVESKSPPATPKKGKSFGKSDFPSLGPSLGSQQQQSLNYSGRSSLSIPMKKISVSKTIEKDEENSKSKKKKKGMVEKSNLNDHSKRKKKPLTLQNIFDDADPDCPLEDYSMGNLGDYESYAPVQTSNIRTYSLEDDQPKSSQFKIRPPDFEENDFPTLGGGKPAAKLNSSNKKKNQAPPGFKKKQPNVSEVFANTNMTFTSSLGQEFAVPPAVESSKKISNKSMEEVPLKKSNSPFLLPPNFEQRNNALINTINELCNGSVDKFSKFKELAASFRSGNMKGKEYYEKCRQVVGKNAFLNFLPEFLALLPDINKQQAVLEAYKSNDGGKSGAICFAVCAVCQQVLISEDFPMHMDTHDQMEFPSLVSTNRNRT